MTEPRTTTGSVTCGLCQGPILVEFRRHPSGPARLDIVDLAPMREHWATCTGMQPPASAPPQALHSELVGRIYQLLDGGHYVSKAGSGACTMCGTDRDHCLGNLQKASKRGLATMRDPGKFSCCPSCGSGNTHPAPGETWDCSIWAAQHGATA